MTLWRMKGVSIGRFHSITNLHQWRQTMRDRRLRLFPRTTRQYATRNLTIWGSLNSRLRGGREDRSEVCTCMNSYLFAKVSTSLPRDSAQPIKESAFLWSLRACVSWNTLRSKFLCEYHSSFILEKENLEFETTMHLIDTFSIGCTAQSANSANPKLLFLNCMYYFSSYIKIEKDTVSLFSCYLRWDVFLSPVYILNYRLERGEGRMKNVPWGAGSGRGGKREEKRRKSSTDKRNRRKRRL